MKVKNGELYGGVVDGEMITVKDALAHLIKDDDIPIKYALPLIRTAKIIISEFDIVEQKRNQLIMKYGDKDEKGNVRIVFPNDPEGKPPTVGAERFVKEHNELMGFESDIKAEKIKIPDNIKVSYKDLAVLDSFIELVEVK